MENKAHTNIYTYLKWFKLMSIFNMFIVNSSLTKHIWASLNNSDSLFKTLEATEKSAAPTAEKYDLQLVLLISLVL